MNDIPLDKAQAIRRFVQRAREEYAADPDSFDANPTRQDAAMLNVLLACEQAIALANHVIKTRQLGIPTSSGESFELLAAAGVIDPNLSARLQKMVAYRNAVEDHYQRMDIEIVRSVIAEGLEEMVEIGDGVTVMLEG